VFARLHSGMYSEERASSPLSTEGSEILSSLSMAGEKGRVKALLTDKHLCFESRTGHALDLRLDTISRVHHHSTTLIPGWMGFIGLILVWVSWRVMIGHAQLAMGLFGILLTSGWVITRRPTLTIDTEAGDCHVLFGNDSNLMRLCILIQRMKEGASLEDARKGLEILHRDTDFPRMTSIAEEASKPAPLPEINPSPSLSMFLDDLDLESGEIIEAEEVEPLPSWFDGPELEPEIPDSLLQRARENLHTRRDAAWPSPQPVNPYQGMWRTEEPAFLNQQNIEPSNQPSLTPTPDSFLPSFVGSPQDGVHIPTPGSFSDPDQPLPVMAEAEEEEDFSIVAQARVENSQLELKENEIDDGEKFPTLNRLSGRAKGRLRVKASSRRNNRTRGLVSSLVNPALRRISGSILRLRSSQDHQEEIAESIRNLSEERGGDLSEQDVEQMMSHLSRRESIPTEFGSLVESDEHNVRTGGVGGITRLDA